MEKSGVRTMAVLCWSLVVGVAACGDERSLTGGWQGQVETLPSGQILVTNTGAGQWRPEEGWKVSEELRIGSVEGDGPDSFGDISGFAIDERGRIWVLDGQAKEVRIFDSAGTHVRSVGRDGAGPGEFELPVRIDVAPDGQVWVMDPSNARVTVLDSAGDYQRGIPTVSGFVLIPWPGGFDNEGHYYGPAARYEPELRFGLVRYDQDLSPVDTFDTPTDPVERDGFRIESGGRTRVAAGIPFQGGLSWRLTRQGTIWALVSDQYRMFELTLTGDTIRSLTKAFDPVPVREHERVAALEDLSWFTDQGGRVDPTRIPDHKPAVSGFFVDEEGYLWVWHSTSGDLPSSFDVFDPSGFFLGVVHLPFGLHSNPEPTVRGNEIYGVTTDELGVEYLVRGRILDRRSDH